MKTKIKELIENYGGNIKEIIISSDTPSCKYYKYITSYLGYKVEFMFINYYNVVHWEVVAEFFEDPDMNLLIRNFKDVSKKYEYYKTLADNWKYIESYINYIKENIA